MLNLDGMDKSSGHSSVQPSRDERRSAGDEREGGVTDGSRAGTECSSLAPYAWLTLLIVTNLVVSTLSGAHDLVRRGRPYDLAMPFFYESTAAAATLILLPALRRGVRFLGCGRSVPASLAIALLIGSLYSAGHIVLMVLLRKLGFVAMGGSYGFSWLTETPYEYWRDLLAALVLGGGFWLFDRKPAGTGAPLEASDAPADAARDDAHLWLRDGATNIRVDARGILSIASAGNYVEVQLADRRHLIRGTLAAEEARLRPFGLRRVHRTKLANLNHVVAVELKPSGDFSLRLDNDEMILGSRRYKDALADMPAAIGARKEAPLGVPSRG